MVSDLDDMRKALTSLSPSELKRGRRPRRSPTPSGLVLPSSPIAAAALEYHAQRMKLAEELILRDALVGELTSIQHVLRIAGDAIKDGAPLTPSIGGFVSGALAKIYDGLAADDAFGIKRKRGGRDTRQAKYRAFCHTDFVERLREIEGATLESSIAVAAECFGVSEDTVKHGWKRNYLEARRLIGLEKKFLGKVIPISLP